MQCVVYGVVVSLNNFSLLLYVLSSKKLIKSFHSSCDLLVKSSKNWFPNWIWKKLSPAYFRVNFYCESRVAVCFSTYVKLLITDEKNSYTYSGKIFALDRRSRHIFSEVFDNLSNGKRPMIKIYSIMFSMLFSRIFRKVMNELCSRLNFFALYKDFLKCVGSTFYFLQLCRGFGIFIFE